MRLPALGPRLDAVASFIPQGSRLIDVGSDHALLPVVLLAQGRIRAAVAIDLREKPLARGRRRAEQFGVADRISFIRGDGLAITPDVDDVVVVAGLGGRTVAQIVLDSTFCGRFILVAHNGLGELRAALTEGALRIEDEKIAVEGGRAYVIMVARRGIPTALTEAEIEIGPVLIRKLDDNDPELSVYFASLRRQFNKRQKSRPELSEILRLLPISEEIQ